MSGSVPDVLVVFLLCKVGQRYKCIVILRIVAKVECPDGHSVLKRQIVGAAGFAENVAEPVPANDNGANFKLFISHKKTPPSHILPYSRAGRKRKRRREIMIAVFGKRGPDGRFLPGETFEFKHPGEENGESVIDALARWAAERYRREQEQKEAKKT